MIIFNKFWNWLKLLLTKAYKKNCLNKTKILTHLEQTLPNKKMFSVKDVVEKIKELVK